MAVEVSEEGAHVMWWVTLDPQSPHDAHSVFASASVFRISQDFRPFPSSFWETSAFPNKSCSSFMTSSWNFWPLLFQVFFWIPAIFFFSCYFWFIKLFIHPFNQLSIVWSIHSCIHLSIYLSICHPASIHPPTHPSIHPFIHSYIYSPIQQVFIEHLLCGGPLQNTRDKMGRKYIHMASALMQFMIWQIAGAWCVRVSVCVYWRQRY